jgi:hypothetical protein
MADNARSAVIAGLFLQTGNEFFLCSAGDFSVVDLLDLYA